MRHDAPALTHSSSVQRHGYFGMMEVTDLCPRHKDAAQNVVRKSSYRVQKGASMTDAPFYEDVLLLQLRYNCLRRGQRCVDGCQ